MIALPRHIATLDIVRFVAAMAVVAYHFLYRGPLGEGLEVTFETGHWLGLGVEHLYLGVHLFFAVSGFVIMASVGNRDAFTFAVARFVRLWPVFALCVTITAIALAFGDEPISWRSWAANLTFFAPALGEPFVDGVYWSIVVEIVFYGWVALMIAVGILPRHLLAFATVWLVAIGVNELVLDSGVLRFGLITRFGPWFLFGILMHHALTSGAGRWLGALLIATIALSMHNAATEQMAVAAKYGSEANVPAILIMNALLLLAFLAALQWRFAVKPMGWVTVAGALTYPLYLLHQKIGYLALNELAPIVGKHSALAFVTLGALTIAWLVSERFDRPARRALRGLIDTVLSVMPMVGDRRTA